MGPVASANTYFFLVILLLFLKRLDTVPGYCPIPCHCTLEILNCSRFGHPPGLHSVPHPQPAAHPHAFFFLDFTGNAISSIGKQVWNAYPWAEHLVLKGNGLSQVQNTSLEGLLMLTHLDLSCNKIQVIQRKAFEVVPFLRFINFSGNILDRISHGAFEAWHGMQFLLKLDLTHNPLVVIEDDYFYRLPSLKILDLGATEITAKVLMNILRNSLQLKTLFLPKKMSCCLCHIKNDFEILRDTVKIDCANECNGRTNLCEKDDSLNKMRKEIMKVLEIRKMNASRTLTIMPEKLSQKLTVSNVNNPNIVDLTPRLLKSVKELKKLKADDFLQIKLTDKNELTKLYMLANLVQMALKEKIAEVDNQKAKVQNNVEESADVNIKKSGHLKKVKRDIWLGEKQQKRETFLRFGRSRREFARALMQHVEQPNSFNVHHRTRLLMKLVDDQEDQQSAASLPTHNQEASESSSEQPILQLSTTTPSLTTPVTLDTTLAGKVIIILKHTNISKTLPESEKTVEEKQEEVAPKTNSQPGIEVLFKLLRHWQKSYQGHDTSNDTSNPPADNSETSLNELSPDITLSHGLHWKHRERKTTTVHPPLGILPTEDDYLLKGDLFEAALNEKLTTLIPNAPVRNLISHVIRILKMDCTEPKVQLACAKLISRTGLLMKLFSQRENMKKTPSQWKSYLLSVKNVANMTTANPRNQGTPEVVSQEISEYGYGNKLLLAVSVTAVIMITIAIICLIEICSQRSAAKDGTSQEKRTLFGRRKKSAEEASSIVSLLDKPLWLKESNEPLNEVQRISLADKLQDVETSDEEKAYSWARPPSVIEKPPSRKSSSRKGSQITEVSPVKKLSSRTLTPIMASELPSGPAPAPPPPPPELGPTSEAEASSKPESSGGEEESSKGASSGGGSEED